jgi:hypothetical protein
MARAILTPELVAARLDAAREHGHITAAEHPELSKNHHFAQPFTKPVFFGTTAVDGRNGRIYLALPATVFDINGYAFDHLLSCWGGEATTTLPSRPIASSS